MNGISDLISHGRLARYGNVLDDKCLARYFFNISFCESLYPALSVFEVVLRNKADIVLTRHLGSGWIFEAVQRDKRLAELHRIKDKNVLIDNLTLAFWSRLFHPSSRELIWSKCPDALAEIFEKRKASLNLSKIGFEIDQIRRCRNRFSHNGSMLIVPKRHMSCYQIHNLLLRMIKELGGKPLLRHLKSIDRFDMMFQLARDLGYIPGEEVIPEVE